MNANELRNSLSSRNIDFFTFTAPLEEANVIKNFIHNAGFNTVTFTRNGESLVVVEDSNFTRQILKENIFPALEEAVCSLIGETNHNLTVLPSFIDGQVSSATKGKEGVLRFKAQKLLNKYGQSAIYEYLKEDWDLNQDVMEDGMKKAVRNLIENY